MLKFIRSLFGSTPAQAAVLAPDAVPGWLDAREKEVRAVLMADTKEPMDAIKTSTANLKLIVNTLRDAEQAPEMHPRIKSIAKNSLPLFLRSMNTALAKELSGEPEAFYVTSVESVKGCINAMRGQGRYLMVAFPEEMKATKAGIDAIGHEINRMTKILGQFKGEMAKIDAARQAFAAVIDTRTDLDHSVGKEDRARARKSEIAENIAKIDEETARLKSDPSLEALKVEEAAYAELVKKRDDVLRLYVSATMTASHVLRKAEKIASRKHLTKEIHVLCDAMDVLSDHEVADSEIMISVLSAACPVTEKMIADGDLLLKNKDERMVFSDTKKFCLDLGDLCIKYREAATACEKAGTKIAHHPVTTRLHTLEREKTQLESMQAREEESLHELIEWRKKTEAGIPDQKVRLEKVLGDVSSGQVSVSWDTGSGPALSPE